VRTPEGLGSLDEDPRWPGRPRRGPVWPQVPTTRATMLDGDSGGLIECMRRQGKPHKVKTRRGEAVGDGAGEEERETTGVRVYFALIPC